MKILIRYTPSSVSLIYSVLSVQSPSAYVCVWVSVDWEVIAGSVDP